MGTRQVFPGRSFLTTSVSWRPSRTIKAQPKPVKFYFDSGAVDFTGGDDGRQLTATQLKELRRIGWRKNLRHYVDEHPMTPAQLAASGLRRDKWKKNSDQPAQRVLLADARLAGADISIPAGKLSGSNLACAAPPSRQQEFSLLRRNSASRFSEYFSTGNVTTGRSGFHRRFPRQSLGHGGQPPTGGAFPWATSACRDH